MSKKKHHIGKLYPNDPCLCGSGKKWKKCCKVKSKIDLMMQDVAKRFRMRPQQIFDETGSVTGRPFIDTVGSNVRFRAVGNKVYKRDIKETFHEFLLFLFVQKIGKSWLNQEFAKKTEEQHILAQWILEGSNKLRTDLKKNERLDAYQVPLTGNMKELLALQYDFYSLDHCRGEILPKLLNRLKKKDQFQGARYEIAIAGIAVRAGFEIEWINDTAKHCEFIGVHRITKERVGFETKSHHRDGVLSKTGADFDPYKAKIKITDHIKEALEQGDPSMPLVIFDDINLPLTAGVKTEEKKWVVEVNQLLEDFKFFDNKTKEDRKNYGALFITNFSWHFHEKIVAQENELLVYWHVGGAYSLKPETVGCLEEAVKQYGYVPHKLDERVNI